MCEMKREKSQLAIFANELDGFTVSKNIRQLRLSTYVDLCFFHEGQAEAN